MLSRAKLDIYFLKGSSIELRWYQRWMIDIADYTNVHRLLTMNKQDQTKLTKFFYKSFAR